MTMGQFRKNLPYVMNSKMKFPGLHRQILTIAQGPLDMFSNKKKLNMTSRTGPLSITYG